MSNLKQSVMNDDLEKEIERVKQKLSDYLRVVNLLNVSKEDKERQTNLMLEDLSKLLKQRKR